jgi:hypothetical protein
MSDPPASLSGPHKQPCHVPAGPEASYLLDSKMGKVGRAGAGQNLREADSEWVWVFLRVGTKVSPLEGDIEGQ